MSHCETDYLDELDNIVTTLDSLIDEVNDEYFKGALQDLKEEAENEIEVAQKQLREERDAEESEMNYQYERSVL